MRSVADGDNCVIVPQRFNSDNDKTQVLRCEAGRLQERILQYCVLLAIADPCGECTEWRCPSWLNSEPYCKIDRAVDTSDPKQAVILLAFFDKRYETQRGRRRA